MQYCVSLQTDQVTLGREFISGAAVAEVARAAEAGGFDAVFVTEHPFPEDAWLASGGHHALDPFVALSVAAASTTSLRVLSNLCVVPYRNPYLLAKAALSLDVLSDGRFVFGCGAGYLEPEFAAVGQPFADRNDRFDDALRSMRAAWAGPGVPVPASGSTHTMLPAPHTPGGPPIWIGGNSRRALRRAVELADGWMPFPNPASQASRRHTPELITVEQLAARLAEARELEAANGRTLRDVMFSPVASGAYGTPAWDAAAFRQEIAAYEAIGVTMMAVHIPAHSRAEYCDLLAGFGHDAR
ncbi:MAG: TIGR03619 family F420-dependent LLM class oxidoreductase [Actinomycetes bacterium]